MLVSPCQVADPKESCQADRENYSGQRRVKLEEQPAKIVSAETEGGGPQDCSCCIGEKKRSPGHAVQTSQERRQDTQQGYKAAEEDNFAAVFTKEELANLYPSEGHADVPPIAHQELVRVPLADPIPQVVTDDGPYGGRGNDEPDI
jgi:hypothetical protein